MAEDSNLVARLRLYAADFRDDSVLLEAADELDRLRAREAELLAQIESMRTGLDDALDKVRRRL